MLRRLLLCCAVLALALAAAPLSAAPAPTGDVEADAAAWHRVQFADRIDAAARALLPDTPRQYVPHDAYVTWLSPAEAARIERAPEVIGVEPVAPAEKRSDALPSGPVVRAEVAVVAGAGAALESLAVQLGAGPVDRHDAPDGGLELVVLDVPAAAVDAIVALPTVLHVGPSPLRLTPEDEGTAQVLAGNLEGLRPVPGFPAFLEGIDLDGEGVKISILDTGVDGRHPDLAGRVEHIDYSLLPTGEPIDSIGHGTHVAGIAAGAPADLPGVGVVRDAQGLAYGQGIAPAASILSQNAIATTRSSFPQGGWSGLTSDAVRAGAVAWNASLTSGEGTGAGYIASARSLDALVRDADPSTDGLQPMTQVWSAGNSGPGESTLTAPKEAKNIIAVGASGSQRAGNIEGMAGFSSRGPALDGRILPHVVAPGQSVASANALPANTLTALCLGPPRDSFALYVRCSGTSMAAPHVVGSVALATQWWRQETGSDPSPALHKALLVNTARPIEFADPVPNNDQGWGRVDLAALFDGATERVYRDEQDVLTTLGESVTFEVEVADPTRPLKVTLAWTDAPGAAGASPALVNDLDLEVEGPDGTRHLGNAFADGRSVTGGSPDRLNNLENVFLHGAAGTYRVTITAANLPEAGVPGHPSEVNQDFALVIDNAREG